MLLSETLQANKLNAFVVAAREAFPEADISVDGDTINVKYNEPGDGVTSIVITDTGAIVTGFTYDDGDFVNKYAWSDTQTGLDVIRAIGNVEIDGYPEGTSLLDACRVN